MFKKLMQRVIYTKWKPIRYIWPYKEGWGIFRANRFTGQKTVVDFYYTKADAVEGCKIENKNR